MGAATIVWFIAAERLPLSVTFPLFSAGPSVVSAIWSVFYFHEIKSCKELKKLAIALLYLLAGLTCICLST